MSQKEYGGKKKKSESHVVLGPRTTDRTST